MPTFESEPAGSRPRSGVEAARPYGMAVRRAPEDASWPGFYVQERALQERQKLAVGVEHPVHLADIAGAERRIEHSGSR